MKHIAGVIIAVIIFAWVTYLGIDIANGQQALNTASDYAADVCKEISESNFSPAIINACGSQAAANGYVMKITLYDDDGNKQSYSYAGGGSQVTAAKDIVMAEIKLDYSYTIPVLNISKPRTLRTAVR